MQKDMSITRIIKVFLFKSKFMTLLKGVSKWLEGPTEINTVYVPAKTKRDIKEVRKDIKSQPTKPAGINKSITKSTGAKKVVVLYQLRTYQLQHSSYVAC